MLVKVEREINDFYNSTKDEVELQAEEETEVETPQEKSEDVQVTFNEVLK